MSTAEEKIHSFNKLGMIMGLERIQDLTFRLGNPQDKLNVIHVAGTNGKGSVCRYIYEVLLANGYSCGIYASPFVSDVTEQIEVNGEALSGDALERCTDKVLTEVDKIVAEGGSSPTEFEIITTVAFEYFAENELDFVILEVGLGGLGDATNIICDPIASVITSISIDHTDFLGSTVEKIAEEKAGIIKPGIPVITAVRGDAAKVIARKAYELKSPLIDSTRVIDSVRGATILDGFTQAFSVSIAGVRYDGMELSMIGVHQIDNAVCALTVIEYLRNKKIITLTSDSVKEGMRRTKLPGRFEVFDEEIPIILDGAHNKEGAIALAKAVASIASERRILTIVGILRDKDYSSMLDSISSFSDYMILTNSPNDRTCSPQLLKDELIKIAPKMDENSIYTEEISEDALKKAHELADDKNVDIIVVCGSLYLVGLIRNQILHNRQEENENEI